MLRGHLHAQPLPWVAASRQGRGWARGIAIGRGTMGLCLRGGTGRVGGEGNGGGTGAGGGTPGRGRSAAAFVLRGAAAQSGEEGGRAGPRGIWGREVLAMGTAAGMRVGGVRVGRGRCPSGTAVGFGAARGRRVPPMGRWDSGPSGVWGRAPWVPRASLPARVSAPSLLQGGASPRRPKSVTAVSFISGVRRSSRCRPGRPRVPIHLPHAAGSVAVGLPP